MLTTIGYERASLDDFLDTLIEAKVEVLIDIRDRAQSRRKGFSKTALAQALSRVGIAYKHLRALGDPKEGREAARAGDLSKFREVYSQVLMGEPAREAIQQIIEIAGSKRIALMCYEREYQHCHRNMVAIELETIIGCNATHLAVHSNEPSVSSTRRVLHSGESAAA